VVIRALIESVAMTFRLKIVMSPRPRLCLIVEPEPALGLDLADALDSTGCFIAGPFSSSKDALGWLQGFTPDVAFVDVVEDAASLELVRELQARSISVCHLCGAVRESVTCSGAPRDFTREALLAK
jgi:hypothetical protein